MADIPEGMVKDGKHLVEAGLGTWHAVYDQEGRAKGAIRVPYPLPCVEEGCERVPCTVHDAKWYRQQAKRSRRG